MDILSRLLIVIILFVQDLSAAFLKQFAGSNRMRFPLHCKEFIIISIQLENFKYLNDKLFKNEALRNHEKASLDIYIQITITAIMS